jgi:hypothetical protein
VCSIPDAESRSRAHCEDSLRPASRIDRRTMEKRAKSQAAANQAAATAEKAAPPPCPGSIIPRGSARVPIRCPSAVSVNLSVPKKRVGAVACFLPHTFPHPQLILYHLRPAYTFLPLPLIAHFYVLSDTPMAHDHFNSGFFASQPQRAPDLVKRESPELPHALKLPTFAVSSDVQHQVAGGAYAPGIAYGALPAPSAVLPFTMPTLFDPGSQDDDDIEESEEYSRPSTSIAGAFGENSMKRDDRVVRRRSSKGAPVLVPTGEERLLITLSSL